MLPTRFFVEFVQVAAHVPALAVERPSLFFQRANLFFREPSLHAPKGVVRVGFGHGPFEMVPQRHAFEKTTDDVEDLVRVQLPPHGFELVEQRLHDMPFAGAASDQVDDD